MQKHVNLVDLVKSFPTNIYLQNLASIQKRTSSVKFAHLAEKSGKGSIPNLSTKVDVALRWSADSYSDSILSFANGVHTPQGGSHVDGMKAAMFFLTYILISC